MTLLLSLLACDTGPDQKVVVFGIDGLEWGMVEELGPQAMPNLHALRDAGVWGTVEATSPVMSPIIWTSVVSGYPGEVHGVAGWTDGRAHAFNASDVRVMRIWDVASAQGLDSLVVGWLMTWPAQPIQGQMLSERLVWSFPMNKDPSDPLLSFSRSQHEDLAGLASPPELAERAAALLPQDAWIEQHPLAYQVREYGAPFHPMLRDELHVRVFEQEWVGSDADLGLVYINGADQVSHLYWSYQDEGAAKLMELQPEEHSRQARLEMQGSSRRAVPYSEAPITAAQIAAGAEFVPDYYRYIDTLVGRVLDVVDLETTTLLICSDHGFKLGAKHPLVGGGHSRRSAVLWAGAGVDAQASIPEGTVLDVGPTLYALLGLPAARDWSGRVQGSVFPDLAEVQPVETWVLQDRAELAVRRGLEDNPQLKAQLEALGYVDGEGRPVLGASRDQAGGD